MMFSDKIHRTLAKLTSMLVLASVPFVSSSADLFEFSTDSTGRNIIEITGDISEFGFVVSDTKSTRVGLDITYGDGTTETWSKTTGYNATYLEITSNGSNLNGSKFAFYTYDYVGKANTESTIVRRPDGTYTLAFATTKPKDPINVIAWRLDSIVYDNWFNIGGFTSKPFIPPTGTPLPGFIFSTLIGILTIAMTLWHRLWHTVRIC